MGRDHFNTGSRMRAVLGSRSLYELAIALRWDRDVGRPPVNPPYVTLAYGVLARLQRSGIRVELDLAEPHTWNYARQLMIEALRTHRLDLPPPSVRPPAWDHWRWMRDRRLATDEGVAELGRAFPPIAVAAANRIGLLHSTGPGSFTHPDHTRTVYGDGTLIRPLYNPPQAVTVTGEDGRPRTMYPHPRTGELLDHPPGRYDPDLLAHHGQLGPVLTHGYVAWHARGKLPYQRIDLAMSHIEAPGAEATTAVQLLRDVHHAAGAGIQAVVYDGALRGVHVDQIMRQFGYIVIAKQATSRTDEDVAGTRLVMTPSGRRARSYPLGTVTHDLPTHQCAHQLAAVGGQVVAVDLDEAGDPVIVSTLARGPVKRQRRATGAYHFNVGYTLDCPSGPFTVWLSPHPGRDGDTRRPENLRVIPTDDPDAQRLYGLRSDAESFHSNFKRTLLVNRAMTLGWRRGLIDLYCFALYNNALTEHRQMLQETGQRPIGPPPRRTGRLAGASGGETPTYTAAPDTRAEQRLTRMRSSRPTTPA